MAVVEIRYTRPPSRVTTFRQQLVHRTPACIITYMAHAELKHPVMVRDQVVLASGAPVVWFTFPAAWHDIGLFHARDGAVTGWYTNILTPVNFLAPLVWETTDLFLDVWLAGERLELLDGDELDTAEDAGAVTPETAARARVEANRILDLCRAGSWPPPLCRDWSLDRVRAFLRDRGGTPPAESV